MVLYAGNITKRILIICPHCKFGSRHDASIIEDAINDEKPIGCVACGEAFNVIVSLPDTRSRTTRAPVQTEQTCPVCKCGEMHKVFHCEYCEHIEEVGKSTRSVGG